MLFQCFHLAMIKAMILWAGNCSDMVFGSYTEKKLAELGLQTHA
jgi:hypothetical protein